jgi:putative lipoprotein
MMNFKKWMLVAAVGTALAGCAQSGSDEMSTQVEQIPDIQTISGSIIYRERIALPENAVVKVTLEDVSLADAPAVILDTQSFTTDGKQVPFNFELKYNSLEIDRRHTYNVNAEIRVDGKLRFITDSSVRVITDVEQTGDVRILLKAVK